MASVIVHVLVCGCSEWSGPGVGLMMGTILVSMLLDLQAMFLQPAPWLSRYLPCICMRHDPCLPALLHIIMTINENGYTL